MIGKITIGKSFRGCLNYCLHDKLQQGNELVFKNRAEIVLYNQCYGDDKELIEQFNELQMHNAKLSKPVMHITLSLAPKEFLSQERLINISNDCAEHFGFSDNQFVAVAHKDTGHQHLHIIVNRVGFDGKTLSDSNSYKKMADCCRKLELKHELKQVLSPRKFLRSELRNLPRMDSRKEKLKKDIQQCLFNSKTMDEFKAKMQRLHYTVMHGRGIAFKDKQKVYTKGSEVGYSLNTIEKQLALQLNKQKQPISITNNHSRGENFAERMNNENHLEKQQFKLEENKVLSTLLDPIEQQQQINPLLMKRKKQRRKGLRI
jgi:hypothetical protein